MADAKVEIQISAKDSASSVFKKVGGAAADLGKGLAVGLAAGGAAIAAGIGASVKVAADFEKQMSAVKAVSGATAQEMAQLSGKALQLGKDTSFSAMEAGRGLEELVKGGVPIADIMNGAAEATLALAEAGGVDLATAAGIATAAINTFNLGGEDMAHVADLVAGAASSSAIDVNDFGMSMSQAGGVIKLAGGTFDDAAVAITAMGKAGYVGSDAGTSLKTMFMNLQPRTKEQIKLFDELGITTKGANNEFFDAQGKVRAFSDVAGVLQDALKGQTEQQKLATLETMFGSDAIRAAGVFVKQGKEGFDQLGEAIGRQGSAAEAGRTRLDNLAGDLDKLGGSVEVAGIKFGQAFQPAMRAAAQAIDSFIAETIIPLAEELGPPLAAAAVRAGEEAVKIGESIRDNVATGLEGFRTKLAEIGTELATWSAEHGNVGKAVSESLIGVSGAALALQLLLQGNWKGAMKEGQDSLTHFGEAADAAKKAVGELRLEIEKLPTTKTILADFELIFGNLGRGLSDLGVVAGAAIPNLLGAAGAGAKAGDEFNILSAAVTFALLPWIVWSKMVELAGAALRGLGDIVNDIPGSFDRLGTAVHGVETAVTDALTQMRTNAATAMAGFTQAVADGIGNAASAAGTKASEIETNVVAALTQMQTGVNAAITGMVAGVVSGLSGMVAGAASAIGDFASTVIGGLTSLAGSASAQASAIGGSIVSGLVGGIQSRAGQVATAAASMVTNALNAARAAVGAQSPATEFIDLGEDVDQGLIEGIEEGIPEAEDVAAELGEAVVDAATDEIEAGSVELHAGRRRHGASRHGWHRCRARQGQATRGRRGRPEGHRRRRHARPGRRDRQAQRRDRPQVSRDRRQGRPRHPRRHR